MQILTCLTTSVFGATKKTNKCLRVLVSQYRQQGDVPQVHCKRAFVALSLCRVIYIYIYIYIYLTACMYVYMLIYYICINYLTTSAFGDSNTSQAGVVAT